MTPRQGTTRRSPLEGIDDFLHNLAPFAPEPALRLQPPVGGRPWELNGRHKPIREEIEVSQPSDLAAGKTAAARPARGGIGGYHAECARLRLVLADQIEKNLLRDARETVL